MKKRTLLGLGMISLFSLMIVKENAAQAAEIDGQSKSSPTTVTITDGDDPSKAILKLEKVPEAYNFKTTASDKDYQIDGSLTGQSIDVFNNTSATTWAVKAVVTGGIKLNDTTTFDVSSFKINDTQLVGTGEPAIVASSPTPATVENNTGLISTPVTKASIGFTDANNVIKAGNTLTGTITYNLYNTAASK